jgi:hypothetical protein
MADRVKAVFLAAMDLPAGQRLALKDLQPREARTNCWARIKPLKEMGKTCAGPTPTISTTVSTNCAPGTKRYSFAGCTSSTNNEPSSRMAS